MRLRERTKMPIECSDTNNGDDNEGPNFDVKRFIAEVEMRPAIWDTSSRFYSDKLLKKECWDQLVDIFINNENASEEERSDCYRILQRKWKSARDCFNRECQRLKMAERGIATSRKSPYVFYKNLSFLHKIMNKNKLISGTPIKTEPSTNDTSSSTDTSIVSNTEPSLNTTDISPISIAGNLSPNYAADMSSSPEQSAAYDVYRVDEVDLTPGPSTLRRPKRCRSEIDLDEDSDLTRMLQPKIQLIEAQTTEIAARTQGDDDSDRLFLLSLLEPLRQVPERLRMTARVRMMQVLDSAVNFDKNMA